MRITVHAKPRAKADVVEKITDFEYTISVKEPPIQGRANRRIIELLAEELNCPQGSIQLVQGFAYKIKVFEVKGV